MAARARASSGSATLRAMTVVRGIELFDVVGTAKAEEELVGLVLVEKVVCVTLPGSAAAVGRESGPAVMGIWQYALNNDRAFGSSVAAAAPQAVRTCRPIMLS